MNANDVLDREYLELRAKILELAAAFDRLNRSDGIVAGDPRMNLLHEALDVVREDADRCDRAERVQMTFSRTYEDDWRQQFNLLPSKPR